MKIRVIEKKYCFYIQKKVRYFLFFTKWEDEYKYSYSLDTHIIRSYRTYQAVMGKIDWYKKKFKNVTVIYDM